MAIFQMILILMIGLIWLEPKVIGISIWTRHGHRSSFIRTEPHKDDLELTGIGLR